MGGGISCFAIGEPHQKFLFQCATCQKIVCTGVEERFQMQLCAECETNRWPHDVHVRGTELYELRLAQLIKENPGDFRTPLMVAAENTDEKSLIGLLEGVDGATPVEVDDKGCTEQSALTRLFAHDVYNLLLSDDERFRIHCIPRDQRLRIGVLLVYHGADVGSDRCDEQYVKGCGIRPEDTMELLAGAIDLVWHPESRLCGAHGGCGAFAEGRRCRR